MMKAKQKFFRLAALLLMLAELFVVQLMFLQPQLALAQATSGQLNSFVNDVSNSTPTPGANGFSAQQSIHDLLCTPNANSSGQDLYVCINRIIRFVIVLAASLSVLMLVWAGYDYMFGGEESVQQAKGILVGVVAGLMIILISFIFLNQINPDLLKIKTIQPPEFTASKLPTCADLAKQFPKAHLDPSTCVGSLGSSATAGVGGSNSGPVSAASFAKKNIVVIGDSLTDNFAQDLRGKLYATPANQPAQYQVKGVGSATIGGWLNGGVGIRNTPVPKLADYLAGLGFKPDIVFVVLGTNNLKGNGVDASQVQGIANVLKAYQAYWVAPPKFPQPSCYQITGDMSVAGDGVIASNFSGGNVFQSANQNFKLDTGKAISPAACKKASNADVKVDTYDIHPSAAGAQSWVDAFWSAIAK